MKATVNDLVAAIEIVGIHEGMKVQNDMEISDPDAIGRMTHVITALKGFSVRSIKFELTSPEGKEMSFDFDIENWDPNNSKTFDTDFEAFLRAE